MTTNGKRRPPRPRIEILGSPSEDEAAAVAAALELYLAETAPAPSDGGSVSPWQRAALCEGVSAKQQAVPPFPGAANNCR